MDKQTEPLKPRGTQAGDVQTPPIIGETRMLPVPDSLPVAPDSMRYDEQATQHSSGESVAPVVVAATHVPGYEILEELGRGGMGVVYKARQKGLNRLVALKMILAGVHASRSETARFRAEAEVIARLHHPNIVQIHEIDEHEGRPYFSMEFADGGNLADRIRGKTQLPLEAAAVVESLARAVHAAHVAGIIHRDLKPANVLLTSGSVPKITDFGLAKRLEDGRGQTKTGDILGTPNYMAPEQAAGRVSLIGPATDIHALGAILYEMLTGRPPFGRETLLETLEQVRSQEPSPTRSIVRDVPHDLEVICSKCLRKEPGERYRTALELAEDLKRFLDGEPILARPMSFGERLIKQVKRQPLRIATGVGAVLALGLILIVLIQRQEDDPPSTPGEKKEPVRVYSDLEIKDSASSVRRKLFERIMQGRTTDGWVRNDLSREDNPDVESWAHGQSVGALLRCPEGTLAEKKELLKSLEILRTGVPRITVMDVPYGWAARIGMNYTQAEPMLWGCIAITSALNTPDLLNGQQRRDYEVFLSETQTILETYAPRHQEDGWHIVAHPKNPNVRNTYVNVLALVTLLEIKRAGLAWKGSTEKRDELLTRTAQWLAKTFQPKEDPPGWYKDDGSRDRVIDGLTLQAYAALLRASNEAAFSLSHEIVECARRHLVECGTRNIKTPDRSAYVSYALTRHDGVEDQLRQNLSFLWYPWAIDACVSWLERARLRNEKGKEVEEVKRVLGHLVVELGAEAVMAGEAFVYIPTERLFGLTSVSR